MEQYYSTFQQVTLFAGIAREEYPAMLRCLAARVKRYQKGEAIFLAGAPAGSIGIVLSGAVDILRDDIAGDRVIVTRLVPTEMFGEVYACAQVEELPVTVACRDKANILFLDFRGIVAGGNCAFRTLLVQNMLGILARKSMGLNRKVDILSRRRTRDKLLAYLWPLAGQAGGEEFTIPYNRAELADYLGVDRSALSAEMGRMRKEGLLDFNRNRFRLRLES